MSRRNHQHGEHPQRPEGTHNRSPEELAAINETLKSFADEYRQRIDNNAGRETYRFWIEVVTVLGVLAYTGLTIGLLFTSQGQLTTAQKQALVAEDTEHRQLRAYLHPVIDREKVDLDNTRLNGPTY